MNSGDASPPRASATGDAWAHAPPLETLKNQGLWNVFFPFVLLNRRRPAEQEKKRTLVDFSLLFLDLLKTFCPLFLSVRSASADGRSSGGGLLWRGWRRWDLLSWWFGLLLVSAWWGRPLVWSVGLLRVCCCWWLNGREAWFSVFSFFWSGGCRPWPLKPRWRWACWRCWGGGMDRSVGVGAGAEGKKSGREGERSGDRLLWGTTTC